MSNRQCQRDERETPPCRFGDRERRRTVLETLLVHRVPTCVAIRELVPCHAVHAVVADRAVVLGARDALLRPASVRRRGRLFARCAREGLADVRMREGVGRERGFGEDGLEFARQEGSVSGGREHELGINWTTSCGAGTYFWYQNPES